MKNNYIFGIDIGGTTVKCGLFLEEGKLVSSSEIKTDTSDGGKNILKDIAGQIDIMLAESNVSKEEVTGIGIGVPGAVKDERIVNKCVNIGWGMVDVAAEMSKYTDIPVKAGNDANVAALGEYWQGGAKGYDSTVMVTLGTGVGGGIIIDGKIIGGADGAAAEIGHMPLVPDLDYSCNCGGKECLEQVASATGIVKTAHRIIEKKLVPGVDFENSVIFNREECYNSSLKDKDNFTAKDVFDAAKAGDMLAEAVVNYTTSYLAKGLVCVSVIVNPQCFLIGGGVSAAGDYLIDKIDTFYRKNAFYATKDTKILKATLGNEAGMYGAAKLVCRDCQGSCQQS